MDLGNFSLSLNVEDIDKSLAFYTNLGFDVIDGGHRNKSFPDSDKMKWRVLQNSSLKIGLFQNMFESNIITFNPKDVIGIQNELKTNDVKFIKEADTNSDSGYVSAMLADPDGNIIMLDQM